MVKGLMFARRIRSGRYGPWGNTLDGRGHRTVTSLIDWCEGREYCRELRSLFYVLSFYVEELEISISQNLELLDTTVLLVPPCPYWDPLRSRIDVRTILWPSGGERDAGRDAGGLCDIKS
jgi:hypothetical protein